MPKTPMAHSSSSLKIPCPLVPGTGCSCPGSILLPADPRAGFQRDSSHSSHGLSPPKPNRGVRVLFPHFPGSLFIGLLARDVKDSPAVPKVALWPHEVTLGTFCQSLKGQEIKVRHQLGQQTENKAFGMSLTSKFQNKNKSHPTHPTLAHTRGFPRFGVTSTGFALIIPKNPNWFPAGLELPIPKQIPNSLPKPPTPIRGFSLCDFPIEKIQINGGKAREGSQGLD